MARKEEIVGPGADEEARFIAAVKRIREKRGWSQGELAKRMAESGWEAFHQTTISRIEKGERPVRLGEARGLASVLETRVDNMIMPTSDAEDLDAVNQAIDFAMKCRKGLVEAVKGYKMSQGLLNVYALGVERRVETNEVSPELVEALTTAKDISETPVEAIFSGALAEHRAESGFLPSEADHGEHSEEA
jgi:transcriptional regulator with XRE-family HTH domain